MLLTSIVIPVLTLVAIFLFSIQKFSKQIGQVAGERFKNVLLSVTKTPIRGVALGAGFAALIHSSTATTVILLGLVNHGLISFSNSLGVILGANIGSTITSQLVALNLTNIAPYIVLLGFVITYFGRAFSRWGKAIFYFGLVFFSLSLIALYIEPVKSNPDVIAMFSHITTLERALLIGIVFTAVIQSSGVTSGLVVLLVGAGLLNFDQAVGVVLGANIGTTATALLASLAFSTSAKKVAVAHFLFNVISVIVFIPFVAPFSAGVESLGGTPQQMVANAHIIFNIGAVVVFLIFLRPFERLVEFLVAPRSR